MEITDTNNNIFKADEKYEFEKMKKNEDYGNSENKLKNDEISQKIEDALKNETWIKENIFAETANTFYEIYGIEWYNEAYKEIVFAKIFSENIPMYVIGYQNPAGSENYYLVTYKNEKVVSKDIPHQDYAVSMFDLHNNIVKTTNDYSIEYYQFSNDEYIKIAEKNIGENAENDETRYKINNQNVSESEFERFEEQYNFEKIEIKLSSEIIN